MKARLILIDVLLMLLANELYSQSISWRLAAGTTGFYPAAIDVYQKTPDTLYAIGFLQPSTYTTMNRCLISTDRGEDWDSTWAPGMGTDYGAIKIDPTDSRTIYTSMISFTIESNDVNMTTDGGQTWLPLFSGRGNPSPLIIIDPVNPRIVYAAQGPGILHRTSDRGQSWVELPNMAATDMMALDISSANDSILFQAGIGGFYKSTDMGQSRITLQTSSDTLLGWRQIVSEPMDPQIVYATFPSVDDSIDIAGVYKSTDGGASWVRKNIGLGRYNRDIFCLALNPKNPKELFLGSSTPTLNPDTLLFHSTDGGEHWEAYGNGLPVHGHIQAIALDTLDDRVYIGVETGAYPGAGIYINDLVTASVSGGPGAGKPFEFHLYQNYPNPFNPATVINYGIPHRSRVRLQIFNVLGESVETLVDEEKEPGNHAAPWNASRLSSGVYFYKIIAGNFVQTRKMVLIK